MGFLNNLKTAMLMAGMMTLFLIVGQLVGGAKGLLMFGAFGVAMNIMSYFLSDKIALMAMRAQEIQREDLPWFHDMVARLAERGGIPMPRLYVCPQPAPNAFATGRNPRHAAVAITQGMLQNFPQHEIEAVIAHELGHVKHRDVLISTIAATIAGVIGYAPYLLMWGGGRDRDNQSPFAAVGAVLAIIAAPIAAMLIQLAISRSREFEADRYSGELTANPLHLASALSRLQNGNEHIPTDTAPAFHSLYIMQPLRADGVGRLFSTHPPTEQRIEMLQAQARRMGLA